jgi:hypothetical protein
LRTQATVEVVVQQHFGRAADGCQVGTIRVARGFAHGPIVSGLADISGRVIPARFRDYR